MIVGTRSALDLIMRVKYETGTEKIVINKDTVVEELVAIYGDYSKYTSEPLKNFIYESNCGKDIFFTGTKDKTIWRLKEIQ